ncbi:hypothetical protein V5799_022673 [Amblyomma americanum]|uniref:Uncharacterized protein n=1 Tax=Amblyomma americanum TaxID=6943 RepID=A0AAQ4ENK3_AMBAM
MQEDSGVRNLTPAAASIDTAELNPEADMVNQEELNQEQVQNMLEHLTLLAAENPRGWMVARAIAYIATIPSCTECVEEFSAQETDSKALRLLTENYLINTMGMTFEMALKVCDVIRSLIPVMGHATT